MKARAAARHEPSTTLKEITIVEDHDLLAESLAFALQHAGVNVQVVPILSSDNVIAFFQERESDIALLDLDLGGEIGSSLSLIPRIRSLGAEVIMMTGVTDRIRLAECLEAGATGLLSKTSKFDDLLASIVAVASGADLLSEIERSLYMTELNNSRKAERTRFEPFDALTAREREILGDMVTGCSAEQISEDRFISVATVRSHVKTILRKLNVHSQLAAVAMATERGWTMPSENELFGHR